jgi:hypothetical protein
VSAFIPSLCAAAAAPISSASLKRLDTFFFTVFICHLSIAPYKNVFYHFLAISDCTFIVSLHSLLEEFDEQIFDALVEKIEILTPAHFVFELKSGLRIEEFKE